MFSGPPPGYNPRNAIFKLPPREQSSAQGAKLMSGGSHFVPKPAGARPWDWEKQDNYFKFRNVNIKRELPYFRISEPPLNLIIGMGSNQSFISPEAVSNYCFNYLLNYDPFEVTNRNDYFFKLPCFSEFKDPKNIK